MRLRFQVMLQGVGFAVPVEEGEPIRGFYTWRRVLAGSPAEAERQAVAALWAEEKVKTLLDMTERHTGSRDGCNLQVTQVNEVSWLSWQFSKYPKGFIFYSDEDEPPIEAAPR